MCSTESKPASLVGEDVIRAMLEFASTSPIGAFVEVDVYQGGTAWHLARLAEEQRRPIYLYDTFCGIPCRGDRDSHVIGDFGDTSAEKVCELIPYARVIEGTFPASAVQMPPIAFCHLDCDQEQSYQEALEFLSGRMVTGGVIWCDDYGHLEGATSAVDEFITGTQYPLIRSGVGKSYIQF